MLDSGETPSKTLKLRELRRVRFIGNRLNFKLKNRISAFLYFVRQHGLVVKALDFILFYRLIRNYSDHGASKQPMNEECFIKVEHN